MQSNGSHVAKRKTIYINNNLLGSNKNIEKTLIHEIQHAIQNIEHFEGGGSTRTSKLAYYNKLGEIEATDVSNRFETEKYQKKDVSLISPESSKENPKHKNLNDYLKNRGIIDKIKDKAYNTVKEFLIMKVGNMMNLLKKILDRVIEKLQIWWWGEDDT